MTRSRTVDAGCRGLVWSDHPWRYGWVLATLFGIGNLIDFLEAL